LCIPRNLLEAGNKRTICLERGFDHRLCDGIVLEANALEQPRTDVGHILTIGKIIRRWIECHNERQKLRSEFEIFCRTLFANFSQSVSTINFEVANEGAQRLAEARADLAQTCVVSVSSLQ
jgi:hypothetical protein